MSIPPPATPGSPLDAVDTPALLIDLDAFERNLARMAGRLAGTGIRLRPHAKTHKSPVIAARQIALGAVGVCCQKVSEAEIMVDGGVPDVLITNEVVGEAKLARLAALAARARIGVCVDDPKAVAPLSAAARRFGADIDVLVEIDVGQGRCGAASPEAAVLLAQELAAAEGLTFAGLQAYHGAAQHIRDPRDRAQAIAASADVTRKTVTALDAAGLGCATIGGAGTGSFEMEAAAGLWNELQPGSYIFMDADYARVGPPAGGEPFEHALFVLATVMSRPVEGRAVLDAGLKAHSTDSGLPVIRGHQRLVVTGASDEHAVMEGTGVPALGERVLLIPGHCDPTVNLHDWYVGLRGLAGPEPLVECVFPVAARGALF
ncbi:MAG: DSD1 family PLP-dependent enzyme [Pseudomonadota bacterium]